MPAVRGVVDLTSELVERAQRGDHEAFDALATAAYHRLYAIARRILRDGYAAEDAVQDALVNAWRNLRTLRDLDRFDAWLNSLLVNACRDQVRRARRRPFEVPVLTIDQPTLEDRLSQLVDRDELERAFLQLSVEQRAALVLTHYVGLSAAEVGGILGIPVGTVYSRLHYGARTMRDALAASRHAGCEPGGGAMRDMPDRPARRMAPVRTRPRAAARPRAGVGRDPPNAQRPRWSRPVAWITGQPAAGRVDGLPAGQGAVLRFAVVLALVAVSVTAGLGLIARNSEVGGPGQPTLAPPAVSPSPPVAVALAVSVDHAPARGRYGAARLAHQRAARPRDAAPGSRGRTAPVGVRGARVRHRPQRGPGHAGAPHDPSRRGRSAVHGHVRRAIHLLHDPVDPELPEARQ